MRGRARIKNYVSCKCSEGHIHHSRGEAQYCSQLHLLKKAGEIKEIKTQVNYSLVVNGKKICGMIPDFLVTYPDGSECVIEYKGFSTEIYALKAKLFAALYPDVKYRVVGAKDLWR